jgi:hypothetical protein
MQKMTKNEAVVLIGGFGSPSAEWRTSKIYALLCDQYDIYVYRYHDFGITGIDANIVALVELLSMLDKKYERVHLVGHSMGGLVARAVDRIHQAATITSLGTPHHGVRFRTHWLPFRSAQQMDVKSRWLNSLNGHHTTTPVFSIAAKYDVFVTVDQAVFDRNNFFIAPTSHLGLLFDSGVAEAVKNFVGSRSVVAV